MILKWYVGTTLCAPDRYVMRALASTDRQIGVCSLSSFIRMRARRMRAYYKIMTPIHAARFAEMVLWGFSAGFGRRNGGLEFSNDEVQRTTVLRRGSGRELVGKHNSFWLGGGSNPATTFVSLFPTLRARQYSTLSTHGCVLSHSRCVHTRCRHWRALCNARESRHPLARC